MSKGNQYKLKPPTKREINEFEEKRIKELLKEHDKKENENPIDEINVDEPYINPNYGKLEKKLKIVFILLKLLELLMYYKK